MCIPPGFGFLIPLRESTGQPVGSGDVDGAQSPEGVDPRRALLACTFLYQKFPHTAPNGAILLRAFFGGPEAPKLLEHDDVALIRMARGQLEQFLGKLPEPSVALARRWPNSLPLYEVGHLERMAELESCIVKLPHIRLIGNAYRGVGLPDLIHSGRAAAREIAAS
jgi:oxygen-dependent protoporphyrinogen oxidase